MSTTAVPDDDDRKSDEEKGNDIASSPLESIPEADQVTPKTLRPQRVRKKTRRYSSPSRNGDNAIPERLKKTPSKRTPKKKHKWDAESLLTDLKSPLATANLRGILSNPIAWDVLNLKERNEILSLFPGKEHIVDAETEAARPNFASLLNDDSFRHDCAAYTENIALGRHDPEWLALAWAAHERRKTGDFDEYLMEKLEKDWEVEIPEEMRAQRRPPDGETAADNVGETLNGLDDAMVMDVIVVQEVIQVEDISSEKTKEAEMDVDVPLQIP